MAKTSEQHPAIKILNSNETTEGILLEMILSPNNRHYGTTSISDKTSMLSRVKNEASLVEWLFHTVFSWTTPIIKLPVSCGYILQEHKEDGSGLQVVTSCSPEEFERLVIVAQHTARCVMLESLTM